MYFRTDRTLEQSGRGEFVRRPAMLFGVGSCVSYASLGRSRGLGDPDTTDPRISAGEFGRALRTHLQTTSAPKLSMEIRRDIIRFLRLSRRFMRMVHEVDRKYIAFDAANWPTTWAEDWGLRNGLLTRGRHRGRRLLEFNHSMVGSSFTAAGNLDARNLADILAFRDPEHAQTSGSLTRLDRVGRWIEDIGHETVHAFHFVTSTRARPATLAARVRASLEEESATRQEEKKIVNEIRRRSKRFSKFAGSSRSTMIRSIERDFFPSAMRRTYLEHFVLTGLLQEATSKTPAADRARIDQRVDAIPLENRPLSDYLKDRPLKFFDPKLKKFLVFSSDYGRLRFILRIIDARWRQLEQSGLVEGTMEHGKEKERILRGHWRAFFGGSKVGYSK